MDIDKIDINIVDPQQMARAIHNLPEQIQEAARLAHDFQFSCEIVPGNIVIAGMGGSAMSGDILRALSFYESQIPVEVFRERFVPSYVDRNSLVLVVSYSGNTQETIEAFKSAHSRGAYIITFSTGGALEKLAKQYNTAHFNMPGGLMPRAAIGYLFVPLLFILRKLKIFALKEGDLHETVKLLCQARDSWGLNSKTSQNAAKQCANAIFGYVPVIYGSNPLTSVAALRWKCQFNENSKVVAFTNRFPELCHNELGGLSKTQVLLEKTAIILLREDDESEHHKRQIELAKQVFIKRVPVINEIWAEGKSHLARFFYLLYYGDFVSLYLAWLLGEDPSSIEVIDWLKKELAVS